MIAKEIQEFIILTIYKEINHQFEHIEIFSSTDLLLVSVYITPEMKKVNVLPIKECEKMIKNDISLSELECYMKNIKYTKKDINC